MSGLSYNDWNQAVGQYVFHAGNAGRQIRLAVDPIILQRAAAEGTNPRHFRSPEEAADDFRSVVTSRIELTGWGFEPPRKGRIPYGLAKLTLQVLAVFDIEADNEGHGGYWLALNRMFGRNDRGKMPDDLNRDIHQSAWEDLARWANDLNQGRFGILSEPTDDDGGFIHIRLPLHHGLLRLEDFRTLPRFFRRAGLTPGEELEPEELEAALGDCADDAQVFPRSHARRVLQDGRLPLAAVQIANALAQWDGSDPLDLKTERRTIRLWFSIPRNDARRIRGGLVEIHPGDDSRILDGVQLRDVLGPSGVRSPASVSHQPIRNDLVLAVYSPLTGIFTEARGFDPTDQILITRPRRTETVDKAFGEGLQRIAAGGAVDVIHPRPSLGWVVFRLKVRDDVTAADLPRDLKKCLKRAGPRLTVSGGLRIGRAWLEGAGPSLTILRGGAKVIVDGQEYEAVENRLTPERCPALNEVGPHEAWLPGRHHGRVRFHVEPPKRAKFAGPLVQAGWRWREPPAWPAPWRASDEADGGRLRGPVVEGDWPPVRPPRLPAAPAAEVALKLAVALRRPNPARRSAAIRLAIANISHPNLLARQLARALAAKERQRHV